ncbi:hypothetical protein [Acinetobacter sp. ANC 5502]
MSLNSNRFTLKILGVFTLGIVKITPEELCKIRWHAAFILFVSIILIRLPAYLEAIYLFSSKQ